MRAELYTHTGRHLDAHEYLDGQLQGGMPAP